MYICPHTHCRDFDESGKDTISRVLGVAEEAGFTAIVDVTNTKPATDNEEAILRRFETADRANSTVKYYMYLVLKPEARFLEWALRMYDKYEDIAGFKFFAGGSTNNPGVADKEQSMIYRTLAQREYRGFMMVHCEDNALIRNLFFADDPVTHAYARPRECEIFSVRDQIALACHEDFQGHLHIAHLSVPEAVMAVREAKKHLNVSCGSTIHHLTMDYNMMKRPGGLRYKMNPPLRSLKDVRGLFEIFCSGGIDCIETDHASHRDSEKMNKPYASGIIGLHAYPRFVAYLREAGMGDQMIADVTFGNVVKMFGGRIKAAQRKCVPNAGMNARNLGYDIDPYEGFVFGKR